jgi:hypothetical protein
MDVKHFETATTANSIFDINLIAEPPFKDDTWQLISVVAMPSKDAVYYFWQREIIFP